MWVWDHHPAALSELVSFAKKKHVTVLYLNTRNHFDEGTKAAIEGAARAGIRVELLIAKSEWILPAQRADAVDVAKSAASFVRALPGAKPIGVHLDAEPHALAGWGLHQNEFENDYLDLIDDLRAVLTAANLPLHVDVPTWFQDKPVTRDGVTQPLSSAILDRVHDVTLMDYRDFPSGAGGIVDRAGGWIAEAAESGGHVRVGVETQLGLADPSDSFGEEGEAAMNRALAATRTTFGKSRAFVGVAVHHYDSWKTMAR
jgi:hypothetical protein